MVVLRSLLLCLEFCAFSELLILVGDFNLCHSFFLEYFKNIWVLLNQIIHESNLHIYSSWRKLF